MWRTIIGSIAIAGLLASCVPGTSDERIASTVVITKRAPEAKFSSFRTFYLRPEIRELKDEGETDVLDDAIADPLLAATKENLISRGYEAAATKEEADLAVEMVYINTQWVASSCYSWWDSYYWGYPGYPYYPYYGGCSAATWQTHTLATTIVDLTAATGTTASALLSDGGSDAAAPPVLDAATGAGGSSGSDAGGTADGGASGTGGSNSGSGGTSSGGTTSGEDGGPIRPLPALGGIWFSGVYGIVYGGAAESLQKGLDGIDQAFAQSPYLTTEK